MIGTKEGWSMIERQSGQMSMVILDLAELIPTDHILREINQMVSFDFIYELAAPYCLANSRPSVDPVSMFKMLLVGYLYGIKSERRLVQEIQLNIAYRWFCGFELGEKIPDHSTFSKTRVHKCPALYGRDADRWQRNGHRWKLYPHRSFPKQLDWRRGRKSNRESMLSYLDDLDQELASRLEFEMPPSHTVTKKISTSMTSPECGYIHHGDKRGAGYLMEATIHCKHEIITGVDVFPAHERESLLVLRHLEWQKKQLGL